MLSQLFEPTTIWFTIPALLGTGLFFIKLLIMLFLGDGGHGDFDLGHTDTGAAAEIFSVQALLAAAMGFGWSGLIAHKTFDLTAGPSVLVGLGGSILLMGIFLVVMRSMRKLSTSGNIELSTLTGAMGEVTVAIPASGKGTGEVRLVIGDRERRCYATQKSTAAEEIASRTRVRVSAVNPDNTVTVEPV